MNAFLASYLSVAGDRAALNQRSAALRQTERIERRTPRQLEYAAPLA